MLVDSRLVNIYIYIYIYIYTLMTTKSMVKSAWAEDMEQFLYHQDADTKKVKRRLEKI